MDRIISTLLLSSLFIFLACDNTIKVNSTFHNSPVDESSPHYVIYCGMNKLHYCKFELSSGRLVMERHHMVEYEKKGTLVDRQKKALNQLFNKPFFSRENNVFCFPQNSVSATTVSNKNTPKDTTILSHDLAYGKFVSSCKIVYMDKVYKEFAQVFKKQNLEVAFSAAPLAILDGVVANRYNSQNSALIDIEDSAINLYLMTPKKVSIVKLSISYDQIFTDISKQFNVSIDEAREMYFQKGFIGMGPAYEPAKDPVAEKISNILRTYHLAMIEEMKTHFAKFEKKGLKIERVLLTGSRSIAAFTEFLFKQKLMVEVDYVNFFSGIRLGAHYVGEKRQELASNSHEMGSVIGTALEIYASETNQVKNPDIK